MLMIVYVFVVGVDVPESLVLKSSYDLRVCTHQIQSLVLGKINHAIVESILKTMAVFKDHYTGTSALLVLFIEFR